MKYSILKTLALIVVFSMLVPTAALGNPAAPPKITRIESEITIQATSAPPSLDLGAAYQTPDGRVSLIVELQPPPLGLAFQSQGQELEIESAGSQSYLAELAVQQDAVIAEIAVLAPSAEIGLRYRAVFNGFNLLIDPAEAEALRKLGTIKRLYPDRPRNLLLDSSTEVIHAPAFWADLGGQANAGEGIRIAVLDTGIRSENAMFAGADFVQPPGFPRGYCADFPSDPDFQCNDKLIAARYYEPMFDIHNDEVHSPLDIHGHGSHVAGIAAGNPVVVPAGAVVPEDTAISGVAPGAYLMVYKALFVEDGGGVKGTDAMFLAALDDAMLDEADVINNSWGESENIDPADSPYTTAIAALDAAGIVVVFAAGNGGPDEGSIACPGCLEDVITVGASTADRIYANTLDIIWPEVVPDDLKGLAALSGSGPEITADIEGALIYSGAASPGNDEGCASFPPGAFTDGIALIQRGGCSFHEKVNYAWAAGARAVAIFNTEPGFPVRMTGLESTLIPAVFLSKDQGESVRDWAITRSSPVARINTQVAAVRNPYWQDALWASSSRGPNGDPDVLKPDIVAPGFYILSATSPDSAGGESYQFFKGTSMAAPHVSGAAALLIKKHPAWTPQQIKTALTSTANRQVYQPDGSALATPFMAGTGRLDLAGARNLGLTFSQPSFANHACSTQCSWQVEIKNETLEDGSRWDVLVEAPADLHIQVEPSSMILGLGETRTFWVTVDVSDVPLEQWYFGSIRWQHETTTFTEANLPVIIFATEPDQATLEKTADRAFAEPGDLADYAITLINDSPLTTTFTISDPIPANAFYVPDSASGGLSYDVGTAELTGTVQLSGVKMNLVSDPAWPYGPFSLSDYADPMTCPNLDCDEGFIILAGLDFIYNGRQMSDLIWSANGYLQVGADITNLSGPNQNLPDPAAPNNVLAPLWADLDMDACVTGSDKRGWYFGSASDGPIIYDIIEWKEAALKSDPSACFSFQVWIKRETDEIWFVYGPQTEPLSTATVGLENQYGSAGYSYYYNNSGVAPTAGTTLKAIHISDTATFTYALEMGPTLGVDVTNTVQVSNSRTDRVLQDSAMVRVGRQLYLPMLIR